MKNNSISEAAQIIKNGGLVAFPTETVYGLGANALNPFALELIKESKCPIAAPSANKFGQLSPVNAHHVKKQLPNVDYVLDGGNTTVGIESTIVSIEGDTCQLLRPGFITLEDIEKALPDTFVFNSKKPEKLVSPGLLKSHYSPKKPLYILNKPLQNLPESSGLILHSNKQLVYTATNVIYTSQTCNKIEVSANLFTALHAMEEDESIKHIYIEPVEETGLGIAIMDRMKKAAYQYNTSTN